MERVIRFRRLLARYILSGRALWIGMLVVHMPALLALWQTLFSHGAESVRFSSFLSLNLATAFFLLKICGVRFLAFRTDRRSFIAITIGVALLHANVVEARSQSIAVPQEIPVAGTILFVTGLSHLQSAVRTLLSGAQRAPRRSRSSDALARVFPFYPRQLLLAACRCAPRAPPPQLILN